LIGQQDANRVIDLSDQIRELQLQSGLAADRDEEATYFMIPGTWTAAEFRELLAAAA
jgi:hypothetical protein